MAKWSDVWPWWPDAGKRVEVIQNDETITGTIEADEYVCVTEGPDAGTEIPLFTIYVDDGRQLPFNADKWRIL